MVPACVVWFSLVRLGLIGLGWLRLVEFGWVRLALIGLGWVGLGFMVLETEPKASPMLSNGSTVELYP